MRRGMCKDIKSGIPMRQNCKYKNTNTKRHKYTNTQIQMSAKVDIDSLQVERLPVLHHLGSNVSAID